LLEINGCSPITLTLTDSMGLRVDNAVSQIDGAHFYRISDNTQVSAPVNRPYALQVTGTGNGVFDLFLARTIGDGTRTPLGYFASVPVRPGASGIVTFDAAGVPTDME